jgi:hypothetical protein
VRDHFANEARKSICSNVSDHPSHDIAFTADRASDWRLTGAHATSSVATATLIPMPIFGLAADESFINLNNAAEPGFGSLDKTSANAVAHVPSGSIGARADSPMDLEGRNTLLHSQHHMDDAEPRFERVISVLENRPNQMGEAIAARSAVGTFPFPVHSLESVHPLTIATRATYTHRPAAVDEIGRASVFVGEHFLKLPDGHLIDGPWLLPLGHDGSPPMGKD